MKGSVLAVAAATAFATSASALQYAKRDNPKTVHMPVERRQPSPETKEAMRIRRRNRLAKRQKVVSQTLDNFEDGSLYFANVTLGTPAQNFRFHVDTGSSDLWANSNTSSFCQESASQLEQEGDIPCTVSGTYSANGSSTYKYINSDFLISYADTTGAQGDYVSDTLRFGTTSLTAQQFGVGYQSNSSEGVMGIGYPNLEVAVQYNNGKSYPNIPQTMASQGLINTPAYSLWLDDLDSATGNILFGGVDTTKFSGSLTTVPILQEQGQYLEMVVGLSGISVVNNGKNTSVSSTTIPALLDSGSTLMYLPSSVAQSIYSAVGATYSSREGVAICSCSLANNNALTLDFIFSGQLISVSMSQLVLNEGGSGNQCVFGVVPQSGEPYTLGDTFIRNAYIVYDLNANTISLAQTNFNAGSNTDIQEIQSGSGGVPQATGAANAASVAVSGTGSVYAGTKPTATGSVNAGAHARPTMAAGVKVWGAAAAGVGVAMAAL